MNVKALALSFAVIGFAALGWTRAASAMACVNDTDCPNSACGGQVCTYSNTAAPACNPAGTGPKGMDGWCTTDANCKCQSEGATCVGFYCSFTQPKSTGGSSGAGSTGGTGATSGTATTGSNSASGTSASGGGPTSSSGTGGGSASSSSGCSLARPASTGAPWALGLIALGVCAAVSRRRRG